MMNDPEDGTRLLLEAHAAPDPKDGRALGFSFSLWARRDDGWKEVANGFNWGYSDAEDLVDAAEAHLGYEPNDIERIGAAPGRVPHVQDPTREEHPRSRPNQAEGWLSNGQVGPAGTEAGTSTSGRRKT